MPIFAQHGWGDGTRMVKGLEKNLLSGAILSPKHLTQQTLQSKISELRQVSPDTTLLVDPLYYAATVAGEPGARTGNLLSHFSDYFAEKRLRDLRREKKVHEVIERACFFQRSIEGLNGIIMPNIMIVDGLRSESAGIAKLFLDLSEEYASAELKDTDVWITLALGSSCFRNEKSLEDLANEITGLGIQSKGFYLLCETSPANGSDPWYDPFQLSGQMYLNYVLSLSGYDVINGYSFVNAPYLAAAGGNTFGVGWYSNSRYFSLGPYRPSKGGGRRPNRRYLSRKLWARMDFASIRPFWDAFPWLVNGYPTDEPYRNSEASDVDECLQHWETMERYISEVQSIGSTKDRVGILRENLEETIALRSQLVALSMPNFDEQVRNLKLALDLFEEVAEL